MKVKHLIKIECDKLVRKILILRHKVCQKSGRRDNLEVCHFYHRKAHPSVRWDLDNVFLIHREWHRFYDEQFRGEFEIFVLDRLGCFKFRDLTVRANKTKTMSLNDLLDKKKELEEILKEEMIKNGK